MKEFFKYVLATLVAIMCVAVFFVFIGGAIVGGIMASQDSTPQLKEGTILRIPLKGVIQERAQENAFAEILGKDEISASGLDEMLTAIKEAKTNDKIKGIYLEGGMLSADYATLQELRKAILDFKSSNKFVVAYSDSYLQGTYYLASAADKVLMNPSGMLDWHGIASQPIFFKDLLQKVGVKMQVFKVGTFKSAVEPFILTGMSDANRQQVTSFVNDIWDGMCQDVAASRQVSIDSLNAYADRYMMAEESARYVDMKMIDSLTYVDGVRDVLRTLSGQKKNRFIYPSDLAKLYKAPKSENKVAVYYAQGDIVDVSSSTPLNSDKLEIVGSKVVDDLDKLANDDKVKAVVLRINSGGGSAYASEQMWRAIQLLKAKKPVVVSMSGMAASGGYYMSCGADYIIAEPSTLTGSIGIFGMIPDASELLQKKLGLHFDVVKTNKAADFGAMGRGFSADESAAMQQFVNRGYKLFLQRVADGRGMTPEEVDKIAQGRVWTGNQALKIKLVDRLGTLDDAVAEAAKRAELSDYKVIQSPAKESWTERLLSETLKPDYLEQKLKTCLGEYYEPLRFVSTLSGKPELQARIFFVPNLK